MEKSTSQENTENKLMNILFVSRWYPYPFDNGSKIRIFNLIRTLSKSHRIDLISFSSEKVSEERIEGMKRYCQNIQVTEYISGDGGGINSLFGFFSPRPRSTVTSHNLEMQRLIEQADRTGKYDVVISSQLDMAAYTHNWRSSPKLFEEIELTALYEKYAAERNPVTRARRRMMWLKYKYYVKMLLGNFKCCTVVSELERCRVLDVMPNYDRIEVVPNGVDTRYLSGNFGDLESDSMVYSGALSYYANMEAVEYFVDEIFPLIKRQRPGAKVYITGSVKGLDLKGMPAVEGVHFTGYLEDIRPRIARSMVNVVPLKIGGGTRLKILESLALRTPVVSTQKGAEGLNLNAGRDVLIADRPADFAEAVIRIMDDKLLREKLGSQGCETVRRIYDWEIVGEHLNKVLENMV
jgi:polysaccharide biosynthesis protein PslH